jgi:hypothetical protein
MISSDLKKIYSRYCNDFSTWDFMSEKFDVYSMTDKMDYTKFYSPTNPLTKFVKAATNYMDSMKVDYKITLVSFHSECDGGCFVATYNITWNDTKLQSEVFRFETDY